MCCVVWRRLVIPDLHPPLTYDHVKCVGLVKLGQLWCGKRARVWLHLCDGVVHVVYVVQAPTKHSTYWSMTVVVAVVEAGVVHRTAS
jgi:hypothetical protein